MTLSGIATTPGYITLTMVTEYTLVLLVYGIEGSQGGQLSC